MGPFIVSDFCAWHELDMKRLFDLDSMSKHYECRRLFVIIFRIFCECLTRIRDMRSSPAIGIRWRANVGPNCVRRKSGEKMIKSNTWLVWSGSSLQRYVCLHPNHHEGLLIIFPLSNLGRAGDSQARTERLFSDVLLSKELCSAVARLCRLYQSWL